MTVAAHRAFRRLPRFLRFLSCGGLAAGLNWTSRFGWSLLLPFGLAVIAAYLTGMLAAFLLFRAYVFDDSDGPVGPQVRGFVLVNLLGMAATWALANLLVYWLLPAAGLGWHVEAIGHGVAIVAPAVTSWFGHRFLTFRRTPAAAG